MSSTEALPVPAMPKGAEALGAWWDEDAARAACDFFHRYLRHTEGEWAGQPFRLTAFERDRIIRPLFGWKRADGTRLYRRAQILIAKKNGKTELGAGVALLMLTGDGEFGGQGFSIASDRDQAKIVFNKAAIMAAFSEELSAALEVFKTSIYCAELQASFRPLSRAPTGKHGFSVSFLVADEWHEWADDDAYDACRKNTAARSQPLEFLISTAGVRGKEPGWSMYDYARKVLEGAIEDPELLVVICEADAEDDWTDEATWAKANPHLGISPKIEFLRAECRKAQQSPRLENAFRRYHLNQWTEQAVRWLPMHHWKECSRAPDEEQLWRALEAEMAGRTCYGGLDLAATQDTNALCYAFPPEGGETRWTYLWRFFLPEDDLSERSDRDGVRYDLWARAGALILTPGNVSDYRAIRARIEADAKVFRIAALAIDRWNATQMSVELADDGLKVELFGQGFASMSGPAKALEREVLEHTMEHGNHPIARWHAANAAVKSDPADNIKPAKDTSTGRIDGIVAQVMAKGIAQAGKHAPSVYEQRGVIAA